MNTLVMVLKCSLFTLQPTALISRRPDSKDLSRSHYKALPQIQAHRLRNTTSTVFENEPWIPQDGNPTLARETEYKQNYHPEQENGDMEYQTGGRGERLYVTDSERQSVTLLVPEGVLLPSEPIVLSREKETILCKLICIELEGFDETKLREIYLDSSLRDPDLNGYCDIQYLDSVLRKHGVRMMTHVMLKYFCTTLFPNFIRLTCSIPDESMYTYFQSEWKILWILIRWLRQKPADLNVQCLKKG